MKKVNIIGDIIGESGYNRHTKSLANALNEVGVDVRIDCAKPPQWERYVNDFELNAVSKKFDPEATTVMIAIPPSWPIGISKKSKKFLGFCVWEGTTIPQFWLKYLMDKRVDKILVPSNHTDDAIVNAANLLGEADFLNKIEIVPHGVDTSKFYPENSPKTKPFIFMANKGWSKGLYDRGGIQWLIQAYNKEFNKDDNVELRIKINSCYNQPNWDIDNEIKNIGVKKSPNRPKILITTDMVDDNGLRDFYNEGDIFISTSMSDAFNLPVLEAMACGLPVIITKFGGQVDFVNDNLGWIINKGKFGYFSNELMYEKTKWFKPDIKEIGKIMRHCYEHQSSVKAKAEIALNESRNWTWRHSAKILKSLL